MVYYCMVPGCTSRTRKIHGVSSHSLPRVLEVCKTWLRAINNPKYGEDTDMETLKNRRVCSLHFKPEDFELNVLGMKSATLLKNAIPSIFTIPDESGEDEQSGTSGTSSDKRICLKILGESAASKDGAGATTTLEPEDDGDISMMDPGSVPSPPTTKLTEQSQQTGGSRVKKCPVCKANLPCAKKICSHCKTVQPVKPRLKKALEKFEGKWEEWTSSRKKNHNLSQIKDTAVLMLEKLKAAGYKPIILLGKPRKTSHKVEVLVPRCTLATYAKESLNKIGSIYEFVCQGWTPYAPGTESEVYTLRLTPCNPSSAGPSVATEVPEEGRGTTQMAMHMGEEAVQVKEEAREEEAVQVQEEAVEEEAVDVNEEAREEEAVQVNEEAREEEAVEEEAVQVKEEAVEEEAMQVKEEAREEEAVQVKEEEVHPDMEGPVDCRKRWKNLRDTHRKERKKEKERCRSGAGASTSRPWRYSQMMAFLNPFLEDRATSSNFPACRGQEDAGDTGEDTATTSQTSSEVERENLFTLFLQPPVSEAPSHTFTPMSTSIVTPTFTSTPLPSTSRERSRPRGQKRSHEESLSPFERQLMGAVEKAVTQTAPPDPDRQFFEGLLPDLKALSARMRADVKFKIHQLIFDAT